MENQPRVGRWAGGAWVPCRKEASTAAGRKIPRNPHPWSAAAMLPPCPRQATLADRRVQRMENQPMVGRWAGGAQVPCRKEAGNAADRKIPRNRPPWSAAAMLPPCPRQATLAANRRPTR
ncbi:MAG: hypothetical protein N2111_08635 [Candidatus Sumerlaeaceae bacterium]|nr:hypothetical protein [Candidatus Sumerlaeaceae bacterium]